MPTDNEIIKDMETCIKYREERECGNCSRIGRYQCAVTLMKDAFDIINRLKAENEKLNVELVGMRGACESYKMHYDNAQAEIEKYRYIEQTVKDFWSELKKLSAFKDLQEPTLTELLEYIEQTNAEAIKEFAERLKDKRDGGTYPYVLVNVIDNLVKEMVGD
jgi:hypothetical protein